MPPGPRLSGVRWRKVIRSSFSLMNRDEASGRVDSRDVCRDWIVGPTNGGRVCRAIIRRAWTSVDVINADAAQVVERESRPFIPLAERISRLSSLFPDWKNVLPPLPSHLPHASRCERYRSTGPRESPAPISTLHASAKSEFTALRFRWKCNSHGYRAISEY